MVLKIHFDSRCVYLNDDSLFAAIMSKESLKGERVCKELQKNYFDDRPTSWFNISVI